MLAESDSLIHLPELRIDIPDDLFEKIESHETDLPRQEGLCLPNPSIKPLTFKMRGAYRTIAYCTPVRETRMTVHGKPHASVPSMTVEVI